MADHEERPPDDWGTVAAKWTFVTTAILAAMYVASVFIFIMR